MGDVPMLLVLCRTTIPSLGLHTLCRAAESPAISVPCRVFGRRTHFPLPTGIRSVLAHGERTRHALVRSRCSETACPVPIGKRNNERKHLV